MDRQPPWRHWNPDPNYQPYDPTQHNPIQYSPTYNPQQYESGPYDPAYPAISPHASSASRHRPPPQAPQPLPHNYPYMPADSSLPHFRESKPAHPQQRPPSMHDAPRPNSYGIINRTNEVHPLGAWLAEREQARVEREEGELSSGAHSRRASERDAKDPPTQNSLPQTSSELVETLPTSSYFHRERAKARRHIQFLYENGLGFPELQQEDLDIGLLREIYLELGLSLDSPPPRTAKARAEAASPTAPATGKQVAAPKIPLAPIQPQRTLPSASSSAKMPSPVLSREDYVARLKAAKSATQTQGGSSAKDLPTRAAANGRVSSPSAAKPPRAQLPAVSATVPRPSVASPAISSAEATAQAKVKAQEATASARKKATERAKEKLSALMAKQGSNGNTNGSRPMEDVQASHDGMVDGLPMMSGALGMPSNSTPTRIPGLALFVDLPATTHGEAEEAMPSSANDTSDAVGRSIPSSMNHTPEGSRPHSAAPRLARKRPVASDFEDAHPVKSARQTIAEPQKTGKHLLTQPRKPVTGSFGQPPGHVDSEPIIIEASDDDSDDGTSIPTRSTLRTLVVRGIESPAEPSPTSKNKLAESHSPSSLKKREEQIAKLKRRIAELQKNRNKSGSGQATPRPDTLLAPNPRTAVVVATGPPTPLATPPNAAGVPPIQQQTRPVQQQASAIAPDAVTASIPNGPPPPTSQVQTLSAIGPKAVLRARIKELEAKLKSMDNGEDAQLSNSDAAASANATRQQNVLQQLPPRNSHEERNRDVLQGARDDMNNQDTLVNDDRILVNGEGSNVQDATGDVSDASQAAEPSHTPICPPPVALPVQSPELPTAQSDPSPNDSDNAMPSPSDSNNMLPNPDKMQTEVGPKEPFQNAGNSVVGEKNHLDSAAPAAEPIETQKEVHSGADSGYTSESALNAMEALWGGEPAETSAVESPENDDVPMDLDEEMAEASDEIRSTLESGEISDYEPEMGIERISEPIANDAPENTPEPDSEDARMDEEDGIEEEDAMNEEDGISDYEPASAGVEMDLEEEDEYEPPDADTDADFDAGTQLPEQPSAFVVGDVDEANKTHVPIIDHVIETSTDGRSTSPAVAGQHLTQSDFEPPRFKPYKSPFSRPPSSKQAGIDPSKQICPAELDGYACHDNGCQWQHWRNVELDARQATDSA